jgi:hypothetical protein
LNGSTTQPTTAGWSDGSSDFDRTGLAAGEYTVTLTTAASCNFVETFFVNEPVISSPPFISLLNDSTLYVDNIFGAEYQWLINGENIAGANENTLIVNEPGIYSVIVTLGDCNLESNEIQIELNAINTIAALSDVSITPNPFHQSIALKLSTSEPLQLDLSLTDLQGRKLLTDRLKVNGTATKTLQLPDLPAGTYLLSLRNGKGEWVQRVVKL